MLLVQNFGIYGRDKAKTSSSFPSFPPSFISEHLLVQAVEGVPITPKEHGKTSYSHCLLILLSAKESGLLFLFYKGSSIFIKKLRLYFYKEKIFLKLYF